MRLKKVTGFIVYGFSLGEADQIISCFTSSGNLQKFVAKGSRKVKSKSAAAVQLFMLGEYVIYCGKGLPFLRQADIIDSFNPLRTSWAKSGAAFAVMELCRLLIAEEARETEAFALVMSYMFHLKKEDYNPLVFDAFRLQLVASLGYEMGFTHCAACGCSLNAGCLQWSAGGALCSQCSKHSQYGMLAGQDNLALLHVIGHHSFSQLAELQFSSAQALAARKYVDSLINWLTEGKTKAQAFRSLFETDGN